MHVVYVELANCVVFRVVLSLLAFLNFLGDTESFDWAHDSFLLSTVNGFLYIQ